MAVASSSITRTHLAHLSLAPLQPAAQHLEQVEAVIDLRQCRTARLAVPYFATQSRISSVPELWRRLADSIDDAGMESSSRAGIPADDWDHRTPHNRIDDNYFCLDLGRRCSPSSQPMERDSADVEPLQRNRRRHFVFHLLSFGLEPDRSAYPDLIRSKLWSDETQWVSALTEAREYSALPRCPYHKPPRSFSRRCCRYTFCMYFSHSLPENF
jgi:hypothetical protein